MCSTPSKNSICITLENQSARFERNTNLRSHIHMAWSRGLLEAVGADRFVAMESSSFHKLPASVWNGISMFYSLSIGENMNILMDVVWDTLVGMLDQFLFSLYSKPWLSQFAHQRRCPSRS